MDYFRNMTLFCRIVELGSFTKVAQDQHVTPAIVGRHISALEDHLGTRLLNRSTRSVNVTKQGQEYYEGCINILNQVNELHDMTINNNNSAPRGLLKISAPQALGKPFLLKAIKTFRKNYPEIKFDLDLNDSPVSVIREDIDLALRISLSLEDSNLVAKPLCKTPLVLVASPAYIKKNGLPSNMIELSQHECIQLKASKNTTAWPFYEAKELKKFSPSWKLSFSENNTYVAAIESGLGIGMIPELFVSDHLKENKLVKISLSKKEVIFTLYALYPSKRNLPFKTSLFLNELNNFFKKI